ncbi:MAG: neutral zinc metallopeptidase [Steroidobacteraceae bacterium]
MARTEGERQHRGPARPARRPHGTSGQRMRWFRNGFDTGKLEACDTFKDAGL